MLTLPMSTRFRIMRSSQNGMILLRGRTCQTQMLFLFMIQITNRKSATKPITVTTLVISMKSDSIAHTKKQLLNPKKTSKKSTLRSWQLSKITKKTNRVAQQSCWKRPSKEYLIVALSLVGCTSKMSWKVVQPSN